MRGCDYRYWKTKIFPLPLSIVAVIGNILVYRCFGDVNKFASMGANRRVSQGSCITTDMVIINGVTMELRTLTVCQNPSSKKAILTITYTHRRFHKTLPN